MLISLLTPSLIAEAASSSNPFAYLTFIFLIGITWVIKYIYKDMKKEKEKTDTIASEREQRLFDVDERHREEAREREKILQEQVNLSQNSLRELTEVINKSFDRLSDAVTDIHENQKEMVKTQKETFEAVQNLNKTVQVLNFDMRDVKSRLENVERRNKESRERKRNDGIYNQ